MKFKVCLRTFAVSVLTAEDQDKCTNNGQHDQLADHAIAEMTIGSYGVTLALQHPGTSHSSGHQDVVVGYRRGDNGIDQITFQNYGSEHINLETEGPLPCWPHGAWNLLQVTLAIETSFVAEFGLVPLLRKTLLTGLQAQINESLRRPQ
jgi:hypothetical protein